MTLLEKFRKPDGPLDAILEAAREATGDAMTGAARFVEDLGKSASNTREDVTRELARAGRRMQVEERLDDVASKIRSELPKGGLDGLAARLQKELPKGGFDELVDKLQRQLPDTDKDRYDRAFLRGWTRARSAYLGIGVTVGILGGIAGAFLLDPHKGPERRRRIVARARATTTQVTSAARAGIDQATAKAKQVAADRGIIDAGRQDPSGTWTSPVTASAAGAPAGTSVVVEREPVAPADLTQWDAVPADAADVPNAASTDARTPVGASTISGENPEPGPGTDSATAPEGEREDWHRTM